MSDEIETRLRRARLEVPPHDQEVEEKALRAALAEVPEPNRPERARRSRLQRVWPKGLATRRRQLALLAAGVVPSIALGVVLGALLWPGPGGAVAGSSYAGPTFTPAAGWTTLTASPDVEDSCPSTRCPMAWATNVPLPANPGPLSVFGAAGVKLTDLPADGIAIAASLGGPYTGPEPDPRKTFPELDVPLTLSDAEIQRGWEGQPATNIPLYLITGWIKGQFVDVRLYLGTQTPSNEMLVEANAELARLQTPDRF